MADALFTYIYGWPYISKHVLFLGQMAIIILYWSNRFATRAATATSATTNTNNWGLRKSESEKAHK